MKTKQFTKANLKTGMRTVAIDGKKGIYFEAAHCGKHIQGVYEGIIVTFNGSWSSAAHLAQGSDPQSHHIAEIYSVPVYELLMKEANGELLWQWETPKSKEQIAYDEAVEATEAARQAYELAQKKLEALNPANK